MHKWPDPCWPALRPLKERSGEQVQPPFVAPVDEGEQRPHPHESTPEGAFPPPRNVPAAKG